MFINAFVTEKKSLLPSIPNESHVSNTVPPENRYKNKRIIFLKYSQALDINKIKICQYIITKIEQHATCYQ